MLTDNERGIGFWRDVIGKYTQGDFVEEIRSIDFDAERPERMIFVLVV